MKSETKKLRKKKNDNFAIYNFPYFKKDQGFLRFFAGKALLAFIACFSGSYYFAEMLEAQEYAFVNALLSGFSCVFFLALLGMFGRRNVIIFAAAALLIPGKSLIEWGEDFFYYIIRVADGNVIDAESILKGKEAAAEPMPMLLVLSAVFGFIFAVSSHHRFNPEAVLTYFAIMIIPSFLSQHTCYTAHFGVFSAALVSLWAVSLASSANASLSVGGTANIAVLDRQYRKNNKKQSPIERIKSDSLHYNRHFSDSAVVFVSALLVVSITASLFPQDGNLKLDGIVKQVSEGVKSIGRWGAEFFENINTSPYKGFFSADGGSINISNGINPEDTPQSNTPVLEVTVKNKDKLYLRGDIGCEFDGRRWKSISDINYGVPEYDVSLRDDDMNLSKARIKLTDALASYAPEIEYYLAWEKMSGYSLGETFIETQKVKINYLQRLNTVIFAGTPTNYTFRSNDLFSVKGDFIALADKGKINSMETSVLYQSGDPEAMLTEFYGSFEYGREDFDSMPVSYDDYLAYLSAYKRYVYDYYTVFPEDERRTVVNLLWQSDFNTEEFQELSYNAEYDMIYRARLAKFLEEYFTSGKYEYSLSADNFSGSETPLYTFLFETKAGHCAMYASSMCLLLRYMGVPARYVTGFTIGGDNCTETAEGYKYTVLQKNLHAWVEVYYDDIGWIPYDPTPPSDNRPSANPYEITTTAVSETTVTTTAEQTTTSEATTASVEETQSETSGSTASDTEVSSFQRTGDPRIVKIILITAGVIILLFIAVMSAAGRIRSLNRKQKETMKFFKNGDAEEAVKEMLEFSLRLLEIRGIYRQKGETPEEFGFRADKTLKAGNIFRNAVPFYERAEFDKAPEFTEEERLLVYASASKLLKNTLDGMKSFKRFVTRIKLFGRRKRNKNI